MANEEMPSESVVGKLRSRKKSREVRAEDLKVSVKCYADIVRAVKPFLPSENSILKNLLIDGMKLPQKCKAIQDAAKKVHEDDYGGFPPAINHSKPDDMKMWVDDLIHRRLNGVRKGNKITWSLKDGNFEFDPNTGKITKV